MRIGELARATGVSIRSLRYYEQQGLLRPHRELGSRGQAGHRRYGDDAVPTVGHIRALLAAGIPTTLIYELLPCVEGPGPRLEQCADPMLRAHLQRVQEQMVALAGAQARLQQLLDRDNPRLGEPNGPRTATCDST